MGFGSIAKGVLGKAALPVTAAFGVKDAYDGVRADDQGAASQAASGAHNVVDGLTFGGFGKLGAKMGYSAPDGTSWGEYTTNAEHELADAEKKAAKIEAKNEAKLEREGTRDMGTAAGVINTGFDKVSGALDAVKKPLLGAIAAGAGAVDHMIDSEHGKVNPVLSAIDAAAGKLESVTDAPSAGHDSVGS